MKKITSWQQAQFVKTNMQESTELQKVGILRVEPTNLHISSLRESRPDWKFIPNSAIQTISNGVRMVCRQITSAVVQRLRLGYISELNTLSTVITITLCDNLNLKVEILTSVKLCFDKM